LYFVLIVGFPAATVRLSAPAPQIDLFTQYTSPWGGQGASTVSDAFPPDSVVELRAYVTYRGDSVPNKHVTYALQAPNGGTLSATSFTGADGLAVVEFSLPSSQDCFGMWTVTASVDVAGTTVSDTLCFLEDWLVEIDINGPPVAHKGSMLELSTTTARICMQNPKQIMEVLLKDTDASFMTDSEPVVWIVVVDELRQFVAASHFYIPMATELNIYDFDNFVETLGAHWTDRMGILLTQYPKAVSVLKETVQISSWSFSGTATIKAHVISYRLGIVYCPGCVNRLWIMQSS
jgi:hypothetical protein